MLSLASLKALDASLDKAVAKNKAAAKSTTNTKKKNRRTCDCCGKSKPRIAYHLNQRTCKKCVRKLSGKAPRRAKHVISKSTRAAAYKRSGGTCERCGKAKATSLHHLTAVCDDPSKGNDLRNLTHVCESCHSYYHSLPGQRHHELAARANRARRAAKLAA